MTDYRREDHENACPCKLCVTFDVAFKVQQEPPGFADAVSLQGMFNWVTGEREKKLNWDLPSDHCLLCGGTKMDAWTVNDHYEIRRYNTKQHEGKYLTSLMLYKGSAMFAVYRGYVELSGGWGKMPFAEAKARFTIWASQMMDLLPEKCTGFASRDVGDWIEIRLSFTELVEETRDQRIERFTRSAGEGRSKAGAGQGPDGKVGSLSGTSSLARHIDAILAAMPGRVSGTPGGQQDSGATDH